MKLLLVTDAWFPQVNGVVHTLDNVMNIIRKNHEVLIVHPNVEGAEHLFTFYYDIPFVKNPLQVVRKYYAKFKPDRVHIATEGSLGLAMRQFCVGNRIGCNTSYHTRLDDYGWIHYGVPKFITKRYLKWFHGYSRKVLVTTRSIAKILGLKNSTVWGRGVDTALFKREPEVCSPEKTIIFVGRVSRDKNLDDFCQIPGLRKILVGDGPYLRTLKSRYPDVEFAGYVPNSQLRRWYAKAQVFVFPSRSDTFGLVMLEAMACGLPVAAYDVPSPSDIVQTGVTGILGDDLAQSVERAFADLDNLSENAVRYAESQSWQSIADQFVAHLCE
ncbi:MAG: glycosyltransferase [Deltaproteobacteria bacterium]